MKKQQSGGGRYAIGVIETEILDENDKKLLPDGMSEEEADKAEHAWDDVVTYYYFRRQQRKGEFYKPDDPDEEYYAHAYDKYLPYGILVEYDKDDYPALPKGWRTKNGYHVRLVKIHELGPIYDERGDSPAPSDPNRPVGAGAGPAVPAADPNRPVGAGAGPAGPAPPSKKEQEDAASYKQDVEMAGGRKKRRVRSKTRKHKKRHGTRRRY